MWKRVNQSTDSANNKCRYPPRTRTSFLSTREVNRSFPANKESNCRSCPAVIVRWGSGWGLGSTEHPLFDIDRLYPLEPLWKCRTNGVSGNNNCKWYLVSHWSTTFSKYSLMQPLQYLGYLTNSTTGLFILPYFLDRLWTDCRRKGPIDNILAGSFHFPRNMSRCVEKS